METTYYTTYGEVRGGCGHSHRTLDAAQRCMQRDNRACRRQGGYSDRYIRVIESREEANNYDLPDGPGRRLNVVEWAEVYTEEAS